MSLTRVVEANLRARTRGGHMLLGTVRGLQVDLDATEPGASPGGGDPSPAPAAADAESQPDQLDWMSGTVKVRVARLPGCSLCSSSLLRKLLPHARRILVGRCYNVCN